LIDDRRAQLSELCEAQQGQLMGEQIHCLYVAKIRLEDIF
jgi:hypothetical protein